QNYLKVADVRAGRSGVNQIADGREERVGIVLGEKPIGTESARAGTFERRRVHERAGGIGRAVDAVGPDARSQRRPGAPCERFGHREGELLVSSASPASGDA